MAIKITSKEQALSILVSKGLLPPPESLFQSSLFGMPIQQFMATQCYLEKNQLMPTYPHVDLLLDIMFYEEKWGYPHCFTKLYSTIKKSIKCLGLDTWLPTPTGWSTVGKIKEGDQVFDEQGNPCNVIAVSDVKLNEKCYKITFSDHTCIITSADHLWSVWSVRGMRSILISTEEMSKDVLTFSGMARYRLDVPKALNLPEVALPVDSYTLGAWLGDGDAREGVITCFDKQIVNEICKSYPVHECNPERQTYRIGPNRVEGYVKRGDEFQWKLRELGVLNNKHIPPIYMRASTEQRLALLQGLMDTDGAITQNGSKCILVSTNKTLANDAILLIRSLGMKAFWRNRVSMFQGQVNGPRYDIEFRAADSFPVFRLQRKAERLTPTFTSRESASSHVQIREIVEIDSVPVKCISVDSPSHLYLCGESMLPTHNTTISGIIQRWVAETWNGQQECICLASDAEQAKGRGYEAFRQTIEKHPRYSPEKRILYGPTGERLWRLTDREAEYYPNGSIIKPVSTDYAGEAGANPTATFITELWTWRLPKHLKFYSEMTIPPTRPKGFKFLDTYAGFRGESSVLWSIWQRLIKEGHQIMADEPFGIAWNNAIKLQAKLWGYPEPDTEDSPVWIHLPSRTIGYIDQGVKARRFQWQLGEAGAVYYQQERAAAITDSDYTRLHENVWSEPVEALMPIQWWDNCLDLNMRGLNPKEPVILSVDASVTHDCTAITVHSRHPEVHHETVLRNCVIWDPELLGGEMNYDKTILPALVEASRAYNIIEIVYDKYQLKYLMDRVSMGTCGDIHMPDGSIVQLKAIAVRSFNQQGERRESDSMLVSMTRDRQIHHDGSMPGFRDQLSQAAGRHDIHENTKLHIEKRDTESKIDAVVAASMGNYECMRYGI